MCKINCSGGCIECAPEEHIEDLQKQVAALTKELDEARTNPRHRA